MRRREFVGVLAGALGGLCIPGGATAAPLEGNGEQFVERWSWAMGQPVHLRLFAASEDAGLEAAALAIAELRRVEAALSLFDSASDLVALNERAGRGRVRVGTDLLAVLRRAERLRGVTGGAFNPAIEPLMRAWGFHLPRESAPTGAELSEARRAVAGARIVVGREDAALTAADSCLDLGGIGVGYGLDRAVLVLRRAGIRRALLEVSGDLIAIGAPPGAAGWEVDIMAERSKERIGSVLLRDAAAATSANTQLVVRYGELVAGHVLDPARGVPADALTQVTVVARTGTQADALSTAMLVSGRRPPGVQEVVLLN